MTVSEAQASLAETVTREAPGIGIDALQRILAAADDYAAARVAECAGAPEDPGFKVIIVESGPADDQLAQRVREMWQYSMRELAQREADRLNEEDGE